jgi:lysophospholipase L1-like esterase
MKETTRRNFLKASGAATGAALLGVGSVQGGGSEGGDGESTGDGNALTDTDADLVGTWTASPLPPAEEGRSAEGFDDETVRMVLRTSVGGSSPRVRLANTFGEDTLTIGHVEIGVQDEGATVVPGTSRSVSFGDLDSILVPAGAKVYSEPVDLEVDAEQNLVVSIYLPEATGPATYHELARHTTYIADSNRAEDASAEGFDTEVTDWFYLEGIDVVSPETNGAIVTLGNSITDGFNSTLDADNTYPDELAERINDSSSVQKSVLNAGISGNRVLSDIAGPNALARLDRDVITQTGVTDVVLLEGINDIGFNMIEGESYEAVTADEIIYGLKQIIARVHAKGLNIYGATLTPFKGADYYYGEGEEKRQAVNEWIRTSDAFDGVFDFDEALEDPDNSLQLLPEYDSGDNLHPSDAGYHEMAETVDLSEFDNEGEEDESASGVLPSPLAI